MKFTRIKGENKPQNIIRLPRLGKLRLGIKKLTQNGKEYPAETDYFVVPAEVQKLFGDRPRALPVMLPVENEEMFLRQYYAVYGSNQKLKCQGDGETAERRDDKGKISQIQCPAPDACEFAQKYKCRARIDLMVVLPDVNCGGVYQLSSGSINTDIDIRSGVEMARHLFGRISWVPMMLKREEKKIADPETGKMMNHWPVSLYPQATVEQVNAIRSDTNRILERQERFALPEPVIEGEFQPEPAQTEQETDKPISEPQPDANGADSFISAISDAKTQHELARLFSANQAGINQLNNKDKAKIIAAKHRREQELTAAVA